MLVELSWVSCRATSGYQSSHSTRLTTTVARTAIARSLGRSATNECLPAAKTSFIIRSTGTQRRAYVVPWPLYMIVTRWPRVYKSQTSYINDVIGYGLATVRVKHLNSVCTALLNRNFKHSTYYPCQGGSVAEWLACWTQAQKGLGSNRSRDAVG